MGDDAPTTQGMPARDGAPEFVGPYRVIEVLGSGGMGIVYLAEQRGTLRRRVAVKVIKPGMDSREVIGRFESERQALALMNHPGIARIFDAGTTEAGNPYFVMEHVPGIPITDYCDRNRLSTAERLRLFVQVCGAVHHAHQKGIIHRDLKPSNVLVAVQDGKPVPKIIDFGVAKATELRLSDITVYTAQGRLIGTPEYMSPEQAEMTGLNIDTTTDVYSLGVILYELLTGRLPFEPGELRRAGLAAIQRIIREVDPPRPSTRISGIGPEESTLVAGRRRTVPPVWRKLVRGELDWITMRAIEKDRTRRYASASELKADVERHLQGEAVAAGPPSARYRLGKALSRHRGLVAGALSVLVALALGLAATAVMYQRSESALREATWRNYTANVRLAASALATYETSAARQALAACPAAYRGWEWDYLNARADQSAAVLTGDGSAVERVDFSPDGRWLAGCLESGAVWIWDARSLAVHARLVVDRVSVLDFSPDGRILAMVAYGDTIVRLWDVAAAGQVGQLSLPEPAGSRLEFTPDGSALAVEGDGIVFLDIGNGGILRTIGAGTGRIRDFRLTPAGTGLLLERGMDSENLGVIELYDLETGTVELSVPTHLAADFELDVSPDGTKCVTHAGLFEGRENPEDRTSLTNDTPFYVVDLATGVVAARTVSVPPVVSDLRFTRDGRHFLSSHWDRTVRVWSADRGELARTLIGHEAEVDGLAVDPQGGRFASASTDGTIRLWNTRRSGPADRLGWNTDDAFYRMVVDADRRRLIDYGWGSVRVLDLESGELKGTLDPGATFVGARAVDIAADGGIMLVASPLSYDPSWSEPEAGIDRGLPVTTIRVWQADLGATPDPVLLEVEAPCAHAAVDAGTGLAALAYGTHDLSCAGYLRTLEPAEAGGDGFRPTAPIEVWDVRTGVRRAGIGTPDLEVGVLEFDPAGTLLAVGTSGGEVLVCRGPSWRTADTLPAHGGAVSAVAFSADSQILVTGTEDGSIGTWDAGSGRMLARLEGNRDSVQGLAISGDNRRIFALTQDRALRVWDAATGDLLLVIRNEHFTYWPDLGFDRQRDVLYVTGVGGENPVSMEYWVEVIDRHRAPTDFED